MKNISGIYKIESKINFKRIYIGSGINVFRRWNKHLSFLRNNKHHSQKLQRHFNKYGESDLTFSILLGCEREYLIANEQFFLDSYKPYFNNSKIAGSTLGYKYSKESCDRCSKSHLGQKAWNKGLKGIIKATPETRKKMSDKRKGEDNPNYGNHHSLEAKRKIGEKSKERKSHLGFKHSPEIRKKISENTKIGMLAAKTLKQLNQN